MTAIIRSIPPMQPAAAETVRDLLERLGDIPPERVLLHPPPGTATEEDVLAAEAQGKLCELVEGTLVEKGMGYRESLLAGAVLSTLRAFVNPRNLGLVAGADGMLRLFAGLVRIPDVSFVAWSRIPGGRVPEQPIPPIAPDLAVEVLSKTNTKREIARKLDEYFRAGTRLAWIIDPRARTARVHTSATEAQTLTEGDSLSGGDVLPGFTLSLKDLFAELDRSMGERK